MPTQVMDEICGCGVITQIMEALKDTRRPYSMLDTFSPHNLCLHVLLFRRAPQIIPYLATTMESLRRGKGKLERKWLEFVDINVIALDSVSTVQKASPLADSGLTWIETPI